MIALLAKWVGRKSGSVPLRFLGSEPGFRFVFSGLADRLGGARRTRLCPKSRILPSYHLGILSVS
jgi:hypothetical protein